MSDLSLQIEHMIRRLAARKITELLDERFIENLFHDFEQATERFLKSDAYLRMVQSDIKGLLMSGLIETTVRELINSEIESIARVEIYRIVVDVIDSDRYLCKCT